VASLLSHHPCPVPRRATPKPPRDDYGEDTPLIRLGVGWNITGGEEKQCLILNFKGKADLRLSLLGR